MAEDYAREGQRAKAISTIEDFLSLWKNADSDLPLKKKAIQLRSNLLAQQ
ncbi:MAG: hypothetical protein WBG29_08445 [Candidatus Acidiferrales bacterium]